MAAANEFWHIFLIDFNNRIIKGDKMAVNLISYEILMIFNVTVCFYKRNTFVAPIQGYFPTSNIPKVP